jgi:hypothetical protein
MDVLTPTMKQKIISEISPPMHFSITFPALTLLRCLQRLTKLIELVKVDEVCLYGTVFYELPFGCVVAGQMNK